MDASNPGKTTYIKCLKTRHSKTEYVDKTDFLSVFLEACDGTYDLVCVTISE